MLNIWNTFYSMRNNSLQSDPNAKLNLLDKKCLSD